MRVFLAHSLPGRARFRARPGSLDADGVMKAVGDVPGIAKTIVNPRTGGILIHYDRETVSAGDIRRLLEGIAVPRKPAPPNPAAGVGGSIWLFAAWQSFRFFLPPPFRTILTFLRAIPFLIAGAKSLVRLRLDVPALDAAAITASLALGNIGSAATLIMLLGAGERLGQAAFPRKLHRRPFPQGGQGVDSRGRWRRPGDFLPGAAEGGSGGAPLRRRGAH